METKRRCQDLVAKTGPPVFGGQDLVARSGSQDLVSRMWKHSNIFWYIPQVNDVTAYQLKIPFRQGNDKAILDSGKIQIPDAKAMSRKRRVCRLCRGVRWYGIFVC